jgi:hypothetical protein
MGSSAFDVILVPVVCATFFGIVAGSAVLAVLKAVEALFDWLGRSDRWIEAVRRPARVVRRRTYRAAMRCGLSRSAHG